MTPDGPTTSPVLLADTPEQWLATHLVHHLRAYDRDVDETTRTWLTVPDLFADDAAHLRASHRAIMADDGATSAAAAKWLVGWYPGRTAHAIGYVYAFASAAVVLAPERLRFGRHPDGWTQLVDLGTPEVAVVAGHPWAGLPGVRVVDDESAMAAVAVASVVAASTAVVDAVRTFAKVGRAALWAEVADELAMAGISDDAGPADPVVLDRLTRAVHAPGAPWRKHPALWIAPTGSTTVAVGQKGGCCLAYLCEQVPPDELDEEQRAWQEAFPPDDLGRSYCNTCSLLARADTEARQLHDLVER